MLAIVKGVVGAGLEPVCWLWETLPSSLRYVSNATIVATVCKPTTSQSLDFSVVVHSAVSAKGFV